MPAPKVLASANDSFEYKIGNPHFHGRTTVRVTGDGKAETSLERGGSVDRYQGAIPRGTLLALRDLLAKHPIDRHRPERMYAIPDEAIIELTLVTGGARTQAMYFDGHRREVAALGELAAVILEVASAVSGGKITY
jgi:hypothetical protein